MNNKTYLSNWINFGTLNVRGINENYKIKTLVSDKKKIQIRHCWITRNSHERKWCG